MRRTALPLLLGLSLPLLAPAAANARKQGELAYAFDQVWNAALRLVRVDLRMPVTDRDPDAGYLLFEYIDHGKRFAGSIELVRGASRGPQPLTRTVIQVPGMPGYVEAMLYDKLQRKLRDELGDAIQPSKPPSKPPQRPSEAGDDPPVQNDDAKP